MKTHCEDKIEFLDEDFLVSGSGYFRLKKINDNRIHMSMSSGKLICFFETKKEEIKIRVEHKEKDPLTCVVPTFKKLNNGQWMWTTGYSGFSSEEDAHKHFYQTIYRNKFKGV